MILSKKMNKIILIHSLIWLSIFLLFSECKIEREFSVDEIVQKLDYLVNDWGKSQFDSLGRSYVFYYFNYLAWR